MDADILYKVGADTHTKPAYEEECLYANSAFDALVEKFDLRIASSSELDGLTTADFGIATEGEPMPVVDWQVAKPPDDVAVVYFDKSQRLSAYSVPAED